jgi:hypothetical protein
VKRITLVLFAFVLALAPLGCQEDLNKNVPKSLPPGAKPFQTTDKGPGAGAENQKTQDRAR